MTINLTAVLITAMVCITLCYLGRSKEKTEATVKVIEIPHFVNQTKSQQAQHLEERMKEKEKEKGENGQ